MIVWEISNDRASIFSGGSDLTLTYKTKPDGSIDWDRPHPRLYLSRDRAEEWMQPFIEKAHQDYLDERYAYAKEEQALLGTEGYSDEYAEELSREEIEWWLSRPALTMHRTDDRTWWGVGDGEWDSRDRRGAAYAWLVRREVVE